MPTSTPPRRPCAPAQSSRFRSSRPRRRAQPFEAPAAQLFGPTDPSRLRCRSSRSRARAGRSGYGSTEPAGAEIAASGARVLPRRRLGHRAASTRTTASAGRSARARPASSSRSTTGSRPSIASRQRSRTPGPQPRGSPSTPPRSALDAGRIAVGGDSAGGNLAAVVAAARPRSRAGAALQLLVYPVTDFDFERALLRASTRTGYGLTQRRDALVLGALPRPGRPCPGSTPRPSRCGQGTSPASRLPACSTVEFDPLRDEGEEYASRLGEAGVPVTLTRHEGLIHGLLPDAGHDSPRAGAARRIGRGAARGVRLVGPTG